MKATVEISLYPLNDDYINCVLQFLEKINRYPFLDVETNGVSTQIFGDLDDIMDMLKKEMKDVLEAYPSMFVMKVGKGELRYDK